MASDINLLERYATTHDADALSQLIQRYAGLVYGTCIRITRNSHDAEDVAQICFMELARRAATVSSSLPGWLHALATSRSIDYIRKAANRRRHEAAALGQEREDQGPTWPQLAPYVDEALEQLSEDLRVPLVMHYLQGHDQAEIASTLAVNQSTVSRRLDNGVRELRKSLKESGNVATITALTSLLGVHGVTAAPAKLLSTLGKLALAGAGSATGVTSSSSSMATVLTACSSKLAVAIAAGSAVVIGLVVLRNVSKHEIGGVLSAENKSAQNELGTNEIHGEIFFLMQDPLEEDRADLEMENSRLLSEVDDMRRELKDEVARRAHLEAELMRLKKGKSDGRKSHSSHRKNGNRLEDVEEIAIVAPGYSDEFQPQASLLAVLELDAHQVDQLRGLGEKTLKNVQRSEIKVATDVSQSRNVISYSIVMRDGQVSREKSNFLARTELVVGQKNMVHMRRSIDQVFKHLENRREIIFRSLRKHGSVDEWSLQIESFNEDGVRQNTSVVTHYRPVSYSTVPARYEHLFRLGNR